VVVEVLVIGIVVDMNAAYLRTGNDQTLKLSRSWSRSNPRSSSGLWSSSRLNIRRKK